MYNQELEKAIFNKIDYNNLVIRKFLTKIFMAIAIFGVFWFDLTISIVNGLFKLVFVRIILTLILTVIIFTGLYALLNTLFLTPINVQPVSGESTSVPE